MRALACGCVLSAQAVSYCKQHSERNPPPGWQPDRSEREQGAPAATPAGKGDRFGRKRWSEETGELEP